ncbi:hypothetical protein DFJ74DRAFT_753137, partial [Hyaloraphidium curvatum]
RQISAAQKPSRGRADSAWHRSATRNSTDPYAMPATPTNTVPMDADVWLRVASFLGTRDLRRLAGTCSLLRDLASAPELWRTYASDAGGCTAALLAGAALRVPTVRMRLRIDSDGLKSRHGRCGTLYAGESTSHAAGRRPSSQAWQLWAEVARRAGYRPRPSPCAYPFLRELGLDIGRCLLGRDGLLRAIPSVCPRLEKLRVFASARDGFCCPGFHQIPLFLPETISEVELFASGPAVGEVAWEAAIVTAAPLLHSLRAVGVFCVTSLACFPTLEEAIVTEPHWNPEAIKACLIQLESARGGLRYLGFVAHAQGFSGSARRCSEALMHAMARFPALEWTSMLQQRPDDCTFDGYRWGRAVRRAHFGVVTYAEIRGFADGTIQGEAGQAWLDYYRCSVDVAWQ